MIKKIINRFGSISKMKFYYQRSITNLTKRERISNKIASRIGTSIFKGKSLLGESEIVNALHTKGFIDFGIVLTQNQINEIKNELSKLNCFDPFRPHYGNFNVEKAPKDVHVANYIREDLVKTPNILNIANDPKILNIVQDFLGATPTISNINCWWSFSGKKEAEQAQLFHRDVDDYKFCKLFIYLTDVNKLDGPHVYLESSANSNSLTKIRRYSDKEIIEEFGNENVRYFTAGAGSMFLVNTYGFHKGLLPVENDRLLLQIQYSLSPIGIEVYKPISLKNTNTYNKFVNRLIIS